MPDTWKNQNTLGVIKPDAHEKTQTSSTRQEIRINTKLSLVKRNRFVLVKMEKHIVQLEQSAYGMRYQEMNRTEYGEVFLTENATL